ncbi:Protein of unknown function [Natronincola peptidivorans]|uniref:DUF445 domain-containing protein n=1 Tax=Natronincola peptidivorans TaxID=426128 RepID=A0A1I0EVG3_9FIRM|nr:DUF445 family protein [Natronincola peptidivorans]SET49594.1 Protein of unknown function [Natronincola peptidivorans]
MNFLTILILAAIGAIIGWVTNLLAVKLLFRPFDPIYISILNIKIQGLIPKRRSEVAVSIGKTIENDLLSIEDIASKLINSHSKEEIFLVIKNKINKIISERLPGIIPSHFKGMIKSYIEDIIDQEGEKIIAEILEAIITKGTSTIELSQMIEEKINEFPLDKLEAVVLSIAKKELKHIEILGAVLGFIIGLLQGILIIALF